MSKDTDPIPKLLRNIVKRGRIAMASGVALGTTAALLPDSSADAQAPDNSRTITLNNPPLNDPARKIRFTNIPPGLSSVRQSEEANPAEPADEGSGLSAEVVGDPVDLEAARTIPKQPEWIRPDAKYKEEFNRAIKDVEVMLNRMYALNYEPFNKVLDYLFETNGFGSDGRPKAQDINGVPYSLLLWFNGADNQQQREKERLSNKGLYSAGWGVYKFQGEDRLGANIWRLNAQKDELKYGEGELTPILEFYKAVLTCKEIGAMIKESGLQDAKAADQYLLNHRPELARRVDEHYKDVLGDIALNQFYLDWGLIEEASIDSPPPELPAK